MSLEDVLFDALKVGFAAHNAPLVTADEFLVAVQGALGRVAFDLFGSDDISVSMTARGPTNFKLAPKLHSSASQKQATLEKSTSTSTTTGSSTTSESGKVRGYVDGCFDIMHSGHYNALRQASMLCDTLVVGVHSCAEIERHKGPPVMSDEERLAQVKACKFVDEVVFDTPYEPSVELLDRLKCDFGVHGDDMPTTADGHNAYDCLRDAGRLRIIKRTEGVSTTDLVGRLLLMTKRHHMKSPAVGPLVTTDVPPLLSLDENKSDSTSSGSNLTLSSASGNSKVDLQKSRPRTSSVDGHYQSGVSSFLPTTWRLTQFSNNKRPSKGQKVVYIDGAFDLFHVGHSETLKKAKAEGDFLYVGIHDDQTVNRAKGRNFPIMNLHERVVNVLSCKYVDEVVIGAPWSVSKDMITTLGIDLVVSGSNSKDRADKGEDRKSDKVDKDPYATAKAMKIFKVVKTERELSTHDVIQRIVDNRLKYQKRNANRSKKDLDYFQKKAFVAEV